MSANVKAGWTSGIRACLQSANVFCTAHSSAAKIASGRLGIRVLEGLLSLRLGKLLSQFINAFSSHLIGVASLLARSYRQGSEEREGPGRLAH